MLKKNLLVGGFLTIAFGALIGCGGANTNTGSNLTGTVKIDGSSTVFPISQAMAEEFMSKNPRVNVTVSESGTGGGFKKWANGETDINDASRKIKDEEQQQAASKQITPIEIPVAYDGISIVVNKENTWVDSLTIDELKKIWEPNSKIKLWSDIRPGWPKEPIKLYGPGNASGTFDYFTEEVIGEAKKSRTDYTASEDDNQLVKGVSGDKNALGYFGYAYYVENKDKLKVVKMEKEKGKPVEPTDQTINDTSYPLSRPIFIYVSNKALQRAEVKEFVTFYIQNAKNIAKSVGYIPMKEEDYQKSLQLVK